MILRQLRMLDGRRPYKPFDIGDAGLSATVDCSGRLILLTEPHPVHGMVALPPFRAQARFDSEAVRRYDGVCRRLAPRRRACIGPMRVRRRCVSPIVGRGYYERRSPHVGRRRSWIDGDPRPHPDDVGGARGVLRMILPRTHSPSRRTGDPGPPSHRAIDRRVCVCLRDRPQRPAHGAPSRLTASAFRDGSREASRAGDARPVSRPWPRWPGTAFVSATLGHDHHSPSTGFAGTP